jgi:predicted ABC-type ATPase
LNIYIIAGPNGAGKTTFAKEFLPHYVDCFEFLNADLIAAGLSPFLPNLHSFRASQLMLERMQKLIDNRNSFAFETTLAAKAYSQKIPKWQALGYRVQLTFIWLPSVELAIDRVANRVRQGGHDVPTPVIQRRYEMGLVNFKQIYSPLVDDWSLLDGSEFHPIEIARKENDSAMVFKPGRWAEFEQQLDNARRRGQK